MRLNPGLTTEQVDNEDMDHILEFLHIHSLETERANKKK